MLSEHGAGPKSFPGGSRDFGAESIGSGEPGDGSSGGPDGSASHRCAACRHCAACRGERARREGGGSKEGR